MKKIPRILALILAAVMLASLTAACGGDKKAEDDAVENLTDDRDSATGSTQTWGEITVFVPDSMNMKGGDGTYEPNDPKTLWLYDNELPTKYIKVMIIDSVDDAQNSVNTTKSINEEYKPTDVVLTLDGQSWKGVTYTAVGTDCSSLYSVINAKVYFVMIGGYKYDGAIVQSILSSLK